MSQSVVIICRNLPVWQYLLNFKIIYMLWHHYPQRKSNHVYVFYINNSHLDGNPFVYHKVIFIRLLKQNI